MKKSKKFVVCGIAACVAGIVFGIAVALCGFARAQGAVVSKAEGIAQDCGIIVGVAEQWYAKEAEFQSPISYHSPFYDVDFDFVFTHRESGTKLKIHPVPQAFHGQLVAGAVEVAVEALPHLVFGQQIQDLLAGVALIPGRIVQKYDLPLLPCRL